MISTALSDLWFGFGVALEPHNLMWCFVGVLVGNMVGDVYKRQADARPRLQGIFIVAQ